MPKARKEVRLEGLEALSASCRALAAGPLSRHPRLRPNRPADEPWIPASAKPTLLYAIGVMDPVEVVTVRGIDLHKPGHDAMWPLSRTHGRWRWSPDGGVFFMGGYQANAEEMDAILAGLERELRRRS